MPALIYLATKKMPTIFLSLLPLTVCIGATKPPNIIVILVDDMGFRHIGC
jgi:hypothetical protein